MRAFMRNGLIGNAGKAAVFLLAIASTFPTCAAASPPAGLATVATDILVAQREAEAREAIAEAERAVLLARLPPHSSRPLAGAVETRPFGAAGMVKAFDLAQQLAGEVCSALPSDRASTVYEPATGQGVVAARTVDSALARLADDLASKNRELQRYIDAHTPSGTKSLSLSAAVLTVVPASIKAVADITSLFKTNVSASGVNYGDGARGLFASALLQSCPDRVIGAGSGYLGEMYHVQHEQLLGRVRSLVDQRAEYANRIAVLEQLADGTKGDLKKEMTAVAKSAGAALKAVDVFVESLKAGEASEKSPLFNAARYLGYAERVKGALVLDFDLRLEGMSILKENLFTGQHLRLSGVALLWYRVHEPDGRVVMARALRRITKPIQVDLRGEDGGGEFWGGGNAAR